jgi:hypothetical protein
MSHGEIQQVGWYVDDWVKATSLGRTKTLELIRTGVIKSVVLGRRRIIVTPPADFLKSLVA